MTSFIKAKDPPTLFQEANKLSVRLPCLICTPVSTPLTKDDKNVNVKITNHRKLTVKFIILFYFLALASGEVFAFKDGDLDIDNAKAGEDFAVGIAEKLPLSSSALSNKY